MPVAPISDPAPSQPQPATDLTPTPPSDPLPTQPSPPPQNDPPPPPSDPPPHVPRVIITRSKNNITIPIKKLTLTTVQTTPTDSEHTTLTPIHAITTDYEPTSDSQAMREPRWHAALSKENNALLHNGTWSLVPHDPSQNVIGCKWVYRIKQLLDGSVD